jgi:hypothetical protein
LVSFYGNADDIIDPDKFYTLLIFIKGDGNFDLDGVENRTVIDLVVSFKRPKTPSETPERNLYFPSKRSFFS